MSYYSRNRSEFFVQKNGWTRSTAVTTIADLNPWELLWHQNNLMAWIRRIHVIEVGQWVSEEVVVASHWGDLIRLSSKVRYWWCLWTSCTFAVVMSWCSTSPSYLWVDYSSKSQVMTTPEYHDLLGGVTLEAPSWCGVLCGDVPTRPASMVRAMARSRRMTELRPS